MEKLADVIKETNTYFLNKTQQQVNTALTIRNWLIGFYIVEYEQNGNDRATYGTGLLKVLAKRLLEKGIKSLQERNLYLCRDFYQAYPQILQSVTAKLYIADFQLIAILQLSLPDDRISQVMTHLSFSHFIELLKADAGPKGRFYEEQAIKNNWPVKELKRAIDSLLYERTGLSRDGIST
ncbi:MAG: cytoplasmic protein, partial [Bacteroidetes bacterium]|nr:cytoplasmic protein [Bacteroidota bacterium]